jgi:predicted NUDIX family phosphoesterase
MTETETTPPRPRHDGSESVLAVLAVPAGAVAGCRFARQGFTRTGPRMTELEDLGALLEVAEFRPRTDDLEADPSWRQVIPYLVPVHQGRLFVHRRGRAGSEARLRGKLTFGGGGHWNPADSDGAGPTQFLGALACAYRERAEEFGTFAAGPVRFAGVLIDDATPVGRCHLGLVFGWDVADPDALEFAPEVVPVGWATPGGVRSAVHLPDLEGWSALILAALPDVLRDGGLLL